MHFTKNMEGGAISSPADMFKKKKFQNNIKTINNYKKFLEILKNKYSIRNFDFYIDMEKDSLYEDKLNVLFDVSGNTKVASIIFIENCQKVFRVGIEEDFKKKKIENLRDIFEKTLNISVLEIFNDGEFGVNVGNIYPQLCKIGTLNALENLIKKEVLFDYSIEYFKVCDTKDLYEAIIFAKNTNMQIVKFIVSDWYSREIGESTNLEIKDISIKENREMIELIGESILLEYQNKKINFCNFLLNLLLRRPDFMKKLYSQEELTDLFNMGIEILKFKDFNGSDFFRYNRDYYIETLKKTYMTEEEKERIQKEEERIAAEEKRLEEMKLEQENKELIEAILIERDNENSSNYEKLNTSYGLYSKAIDRSDFRQYDKNVKNSMSFMNFIKNVVLKNPIVTRNNITDFFGLIGWFVLVEIITKEEAANVICNIQYKEDLEKPKEAVA